MNNSTEEKLEEINFLTIVRVIFGGKPYLVYLDYAKEQVYEHDNLNEISETGLGLAVLEKVKFNKNLTSSLNLPQDILEKAMKAREYKVPLGNKYGED